MKGNQGKLRDEVENFFKQAIVVEGEDGGCDYYKNEDYSRSRREQREVWTIDDIDWLPQKEEWKDLKSLVCLKSTRIQKGTCAVELRYYISSLSSDAFKLTHAIRSHWGVENKLHWQLDVSYGEDNCKICKDHVGSTSFAYALIQPLNNPFSFTKKFLNII